MRDLHSLLPSPRPLILVVVVVVDDDDFKPFVSEKKIE